MRSGKELAEEQREFFAALSGGETPAGFRGRFEIYRYAYVERIRESIAEDFPRLFAFLERPEIAIDSEKVARGLIARNHPTSWTVAEASVPVLSVVGAMLRERGLADAGAETARLAGLDEAESFAAWLEEWPEPRGRCEEWVARFAGDSLRIARTKTWRESGARTFWRGGNGVEAADLADFAPFAGLLALVESPMLFSEFAARAESVVDPARVTDFIRRGIGEGWLRLT